MNEREVNFYNKINAFYKETVHEIVVLSSEIKTLKTENINLAAEVSQKIFNYNFFDSHVADNQRNEESAYAISLEIEEKERKILEKNQKLGDCFLKIEVFFLSEIKKETGFLLKGLNITEAMCLIKNKKLVTKEHEIEFFDLKLNVKRGINMVEKK